MGTIIIKKLRMMKPIRIKNYKEIETKRKKMKTLKR